MRRTPLRAKRPTPRRAEGRVQQERIKPKAGADPTPEQEAYHDWLRKTVKRCECGCGKPPQCTHHILARVPGKGPKRDHWYVARLTHGCHNGREDSIHLLGSEAKFLERHGVDLVAVSVARLEEYRNGKT